MFYTDIDSVKGYKRLLYAELKNNEQQAQEKELRVIAYPGKGDKKWRVLNFGINNDNEKSIAYFKEHLA
jgi:hypothetical protein